MNKFRHASPRRLAREVVLQALYALRMGGESEERVLGSVLLPNPKFQDCDQPFAVLLFRDLAKRFDWYAQKVSGVMDRPMARLGVIEACILCAAVSELEAEGSPEAAVVIDEYVSLSKRFAAPEAYRYVNFVLDRYCGQRSSGEESSQGKA